MQEANSKQIGGNHYKGGYEHWDFVLDTGQNYLQGCATKYISRWRKKNGLEDLKKAQHYVEKLKETELTKNLIELDSITRNSIEQFAKENNLLPHSNEIGSIKAILTNNHKLALMIIEDSIKGELKILAEKQDNTGQEHPFGFDAKQEV